MSWISDDDRIDREQAYRRKLREQQLDDDARPPIHLTWTPWEPTLYSYWPRRL